MVFFIHIELRCMVNHTSDLQNSLLYTGRFKRVCFNAVSPHVFHAVRRLVSQVKTDLEVGPAYLWVSVNPVLPIQHEG